MVSGGVVGAARAQTKGICFDWKTKKLDDPRNMAFSRRPVGNVGQKQKTKVGFLSWYFLKCWRTFQKNAKNPRILS